MSAPRSKPFVTPATYLEIVAQAQRYVLSRGRLVANPCGLGAEPPDGTPGPYLDEVWKVAKLAFDGERVENRFNRALEKLEKIDLDAHEELWQAAFDLVILWVDAAFTFGAAVGVTAAAAGRPFQAQQEMAS
jgi:hypothetical protein